MNIVLYTPELEPITILDLPVWLLDQLEKQGAVRIAVLEPPSFVNKQTPVPDTHNIRTVTVFCEKLRWHNNQTKTILITPDDELALTLKPEWLPGQRAAINGYKAAISHLTDQLIKAMRKN